MTEWEKYGNNQNEIAKVVSTPTPVQMKKHDECHFKQNLKTYATANQGYQESLSLDKKAQILVNDASAHQKHRKSLSPEEKLKF